MRSGLLLAASLFASQAGAQAIVTSRSPERVAVTIYRDPDRGTNPFNLGWLGGYALVSETRHVRIPAGESDLRFEGVTSGLVPQTAIVTGLGAAVLEKNRDARLLSPGGLLDASLGQRLILRRTNKRTGAVRVQDAIVRATNDGVVIQTAAGIEALHCTGLNETLLARSVPSGLSATPTLSVRVRSAEAIERDVMLSYISNNFDWQADYVADLSPDGHSMRLFGWMTLANGDDTGLIDAATQAVAGKLNRNRVYVEAGRATPIAQGCWPEGTTDQISGEVSAGLDANAESIVVTGTRMQAVSAPAPPPPPPPAPALAKVMAVQERLGDVRLYRIPISVTVAARSQKQVALLDQPSVTVEPVLRLRPVIGQFERGFDRVLRTRNNAAHGLGLALPAGKLELFQTGGGRRLLVGEAQTDDRTIGEKVEYVIGESTQVRARQVPIKYGHGDGYALTATNADPASHMIEVELPNNAKAIAGGTLTRRDGWLLWKVAVPRNGKRELRYRIGS
jgi:hypothetical protein